MSEQRPEEQVWVGVLTADLLLGDVHSLKEKRSVVRPVVAELRRFDVAVAEAGHQDLHRRALIAVSTVSGDRAQCADLLDACVEQIEDHPEFAVLGLRREILTMEDLGDLPTFGGMSSGADAGGGRRGAEHDG
jgi:uncharacterized protein YlxP (DUF503 family)